MKVSKVVTKIVLRVFVILLVAAMVPLFQGDQAKLQHIYLTFHYSWQLVFPAIIIISFLFLLITCGLKKFNEPEMNWLLVVNTVVLLAYVIAISIKVMQIVG
ncbi:hypothetical protein [uncultured Mucilaginibacter sp.]|uniref:hypothetical protein n=1 Tax=uncultured Mucilaginibacter sp. TaxID=797541 RepID=UPI0025D35AD0|nr:hypothetical protein [uncultured Mucilaginibacter sp.]